MSRSKGNRRRKASRSDGAGLALGSLTHVGMARSSNQDAYCAILAPNAPLGTDALLAVADGMGGHQAGEVASTMAIRGLVRHLSSPGAEDVTPLPGGGHANLLREVMERVNAEVHQAAARPETRGMGTTLTVTLLAGSSLTIGHVGDSRVYLQRNGQLRQLSKDHSWVAEEVARGALTPEEARTHRRRNILMRAMGTAPRVEVDTLVAEVEEGDTLLLCSDGLHSLVTDGEIAHMLEEHPPKSACQTLVDRANALGGNDNITVIVARVGGLGERAPAPSRRKEKDRAKTVEVKGRRRVRQGGKGRRLPLRIALLPFMILIWTLKLLGRGLWTMLRLLFGRRR